MAVTVDFQLQYPFYKSISTLHEMVSLWKLSIVAAGTRQRIATISFPSEQFTKMFSQPPRKGELNVPEMMRSFIARAWVHNT